MVRLSRLASTLSVLVLLVMVVPAATANPTVPYCPGTLAPAPRAAPVVTQPDVCESVTGRVFPEAIETADYVAQGSRGFASDFVSFTEAEAGLKYLEQKYPDTVSVIEVAQSYGLPSASGALDHFPIYIVEVTNKKSPMPPEEKLDLLFMLSVHANEKGGREGGLRAIEDLAKNVGIASQKVQNGAGMPSPLVGPSGKPVETYHDYLDFMRFYFLFPNVDGWMHDEAPYFGTAPATLYTRENGNGTDLNRQLPTTGWQLQNPGGKRLSLLEPEPRGYAAWLVDGHTWRYAIDIHGQLNHENYVPIMMEAGSHTPQEMARSTRIAETLKERLNSDPHFAQWTTACGAAADLSMGVSKAACSNEFADWSTSWDAIGYTDSGFSGDFFAQSNGLNAQGFDVEMSYNHITFDSQYELGAQFNDYHVHVVRSIVKAFSDAAALDVQVAYETHAKKTLYLESEYVATNLDDPRPTPGGWADNNTADDYWQYSASNPYSARPAKYWSDMQPFVRDGDKPGVLIATTAAGLTKDRLAQFDTLVIPGSAINQFINGPAKPNQIAEGTPDTAKLALVRSWVEGGGNLVLTDAGMEFFDLSGITKDAVDVQHVYAGAINLIRTHELNKDVRGEARQTYEPVPIGFALDNQAPMWLINAQAFQAINGDVAGTGYVGPDVSLGRVTIGAGQIQFIGALLPDPSEEFYHPYGLDDYATTYSGNQILRNMLGFEQVYNTPPVVISGEGKVVQSNNENPQGAMAPVPSQDDGRDDAGTPGLDAVVVVAVLALVSFVARRRRA